MTKEGLEADHLHDLVMAANHQANEFARTGLANLILLNGGAIVAFAPIGGMFGVKIATVQCLALGCLGAFTLGLLSAVGAFLIGFFVNSRLSDVMWSRIREEAQEKSDALVDSHNTLRTCGIWFAIAGVGCFILGSLLGGLALYEGTPAGSNANLLSVPPQV